MLLNVLSYLRRMNGLIRPMFFDNLEGQQTICTRRQYIQFFFKIKKNLVKWFAYGWNFLDKKTTILIFFALSKKRIQGVRYALASGFDSLTGFQKKIFFE